MKITLTSIPFAASFTVIILAVILAACSEQAAVNKGEAAAPPVKAKQWTQDEYFALLQKKAEAGSAEAQFSLGWIYMRGEGFTGVTYMRDVPKDFAKAHDWFQKAAMQGHAKAQYNLGMLYKLGLGLKQDNSHALMWIEKAAAQGHDVAQYQLGAIYAEGSGVEPHLSRACAWLNLAAAQNNEKAKKNYSDIDAKLTPAQRDECRQLAATWEKGKII